MLRIIHSYDVLRLISCFLVANHTNIANNVNDKTYVPPPYTTTTILLYHYSTHRVFNVREAVGPCKPGTRYRGAGWLATGLLLLASPLAIAEFVELLLPPPDGKGMRKAWQVQDISAEAMISAAHRPILIDVER